MSWKPPEDDGGSYVTNYIIEKLDPDTNRWVKAGTSRFPHTTVENLVPKKQYQFRILAENIFGASEPSEPTKTVQTEGKVSIGKETVWQGFVCLLDTDANRKRRSGKGDDARRRKEYPKLDNYDRCCTFENILLT